MKLLLFSDLHLDTPFAWAPTALARQRRQALRDTLGRIIELAEAEQVDAILCAGDLYEHEHFTPDTVRFVQDTFNRAGRPVYLGLMMDTDGVLRVKPQNLLLNLPLAGAS